MTLREVTIVAKSNKLQYMIYDSIYQLETKRGTVIDQHPKPGFKVKKNRKIYLIINAHVPEMVSMPNLIDLSFRDAKSELERRGLSVGNISYIPSMDNKVKRIYFEKEKIDSGTTIPKGSSIDIVLGNQHSYKSTLVPDLTGLTVKEAKELLTDEQLNLGAVAYDNNSIKDYQDSLSAFVYNQKPSGKRYLKLGSDINIFVTIDSTKLDNNN
jgi:beta-lactam-binding protein with PASTA domain